jgi:hypothetical protein
MTVQSHYSPEEIARRGDEIYARLKARLELSDLGRIAAIDIASGDYMVDDTVLAACQRLRAVRPAAEIWAVRIGHPAIHRLGGSRTKLA